MAIPWPLGDRFIHPPACGIAIHRATAGVNDLTQLGQLRQQPLEGGEGFDVRGAVGVGIHLTRTGGRLAKDRHLGVGKGHQQCLGIAGLEQHRPVRQRLQNLEPFGAGGGEGDLVVALLAPVVGQG